MQTAVRRALGRIPPWRVSLDDVTKCAVDPIESLPTQDHVNGFDGVVELLGPAGTHDCGGDVGVGEDPSDSQCGQRHVEVPYPGLFPGA